MKVENVKAFGAELKKQRKKKGYTQAFVAGMTGFSVSFISDLERGKSTAELGKALYLVNMLGMDCLLQDRGA